MPAASDVAPPRDRWLTARSTSECENVGGCTITALGPKATTPILTEDGCSLTNALAAAFATAKREGLTSRAAMLLEMSIARITVASRRGVVIVAMGRADAMTRSASAARKIANGRWARRLRRRPRSLATRPCAASAADRRTRRRRDHT